jgi:hypothetical protein
MQRGPVQAEIRMTNEIPMTKVRMMICVRHFVIRHSDFGLCYRLPFTPADNAGTVDQR